MTKYKFKCYGCDIIYTEEKTTDDYAPKCECCKKKMIDLGEE